MKQVDSHQEEHEKIIEEEDGEGGWVDTHHFASKSVSHKYSVCGGRVFMYVSVHVSLCVCVCV